LEVEEELFSQVGAGIETSWEMQGLPRKSKDTEYS